MAVKTLQQCRNNLDWLWLYAWEDPFARHGNKIVKDLVSTKLLEISKAVPQYRPYIESTLESYMTEEYDNSIYRLRNICGMPTTTMPVMDILNGIHIAFENGVIPSRKDIINLRTSLHKNNLQMNAAFMEMLHVRMEIIAKNPEWAEQFGAKLDNLYRLVSAWMG